MQNTKLFNFFEKIWKEQWGSGICWIWTASKDKDGYGYFYHDNKKGGKAHHFSYKFFKGDIPKGMCVLHKCDNSSCVNPEHLYLGTPQQNMEDRVNREGYRTVRGENSRFAKLKSKEIYEIRSLYELGGKMTDISKRYNTTIQNIYLIVNRKNWKWLK